MYHLLVRRSEMSITVTTWFEYLRQNDAVPIYPVEISLDAMGGGFFQGRDGIEFVLAGDTLLIAGVKYRLAE